jgi:predicted PurR-regulated permease PerM
MKHTPDTTPTESTASDLDPGTRYDRFQRVTFVLMLAAITFGFLIMVRQFLVTLFLAAVFTGLLFPLFNWFTRKLHSKAVAALVTLLLLLILLVLPVAGITMAAYQQGLDLWASGVHTQLLAAATTFGAKLRSILPGNLEHIYPSPQEIASAAENAVAFLGSQAGGWLASAADILLKIALMFLFMFYFLLDGPHMIERIIRWSPLPDRYERALFRRFLIVARGAFMGVFVIGSIQGLLTGLLLWATGVPSPIFLGVLAVFTSIIPAFGAGLIWLPAALYLFLTGSIVGGLVVLIVGAAVISTVDNLLRPMVVGKSIKMHDAMVLVSTLGGLIAFGLPGVLIGPIIAAFFLSAWGTYEAMFKDELDRNRDV